MCLKASHQVLRDIHKDVQQIMVPRTLLREWANATFPSATSYWTFRKMMTLQLALVNLAEYVLHLTRLNADMLYIHQDSGLLSVAYFKFDVDEVSDEFSVLETFMLISIPLSRPRENWMPTDQYLSVWRLTWRNSWPPLEFPGRWQPAWLRQRVAWFNRGPRFPPSWKLCCVMRWSPGTRRRRRMIKMAPIVDKSRAKYLSRSSTKPSRPSWADYKACPPSTGTTRKSAPWWLPPTAMIISVEWIRLGIHGCSIFCCPFFFIFIYNDDKQALNCVLIFHNTLFFFCDL